MHARRIVLSVALAVIPLDGEKRRDVEYARPSGHSLKLDAALPDPTLAAAPAVILVHGGGWSEGDKARGIEPLASALSTAGIAWFSINYRLAPEHVYPAPVEDVGAAVDFVAANATALRVDPDRLFLAGFSAGGHLVALAATKPAVGSKLAGVLSFYGRMDLVSGYEASGPVVQAIRGLMGWDVDARADHSLLAAASPITRIHSQLPPFLMIHGTADPVVPFDDSRRMCEALLAARVPCQLIPISGGGHGMSGWEKIQPGSEFVREVLRWIAARL